MHISQVFEEAIATLESQIAEVMREFCLLRDKKENIAVTLAES
jgi:hypothetical protein